MNITLRQLRAFVTVGALASFTRAAEHLHTTRPALSALIKELESALGVPMFHRSTRRVGLTETGAEFLPLASRILQDLEHAVDAMAELKSLRSGVVRVAAPQLMASTFMPGAIKAFVAEHPDLEVQLVDTVPDATLAKVRDGEVDLAVGGERDASSEVQARLLFVSPSVAVLPPGHPLARRRRAIAWKDLAGERVISFSGEYHLMLNSALAAGGGPIIHPAAEVTYVSTAIGLVGAELGITICSLFARPMIELHGLQIRKLEKPTIVRRFYLFSRKDRALSPAARTFAEFLQVYVRTRFEGKY